MTTLKHKLVLCINGNNQSKNPIQFIWVTRGNFRNQFVLLRYVTASSVIYGLKLSTYLYRKEAVLNFTVFTLK